MGGEEHCIGDTLAAEMAQHGLYHLKSCGALLLVLNGIRLGYVVALRSGDLLKRDI